MSNIPPEAMVRILKSDVRRAIDAGHLPLAAEEIVTRLAAILPTLDEQARTLAAHNAEADEQRDIDRRVAADMMRATDPDRCRPGRVPSAMTLEAERILWDARARRPGHERRHRRDRAQGGGGAVRAYYRITRDHWSGFEVKAWRWWWPFWCQAGCNTHSSVERAEAYARDYAAGSVKYLGALP